MRGISLHAAPARAAATPDTVCTIDDQRLDEISGLVVAGNGYIVVNDGTDNASHRRIFYLNSRCAVRRKIAYPSLPRDTEDLAVAADGTLWVADIGDNGRSRDTVALWKLKPGATRPVLYRFRYPDRAHDAETLVLNGDGTPVIITKEPFAAGLYVPVAEPRTGATTELRKAGSFSIPRTSTDNPFGLAGRYVLTGGATTPDTTKVALRTYADAFEFPVRDGDVIAAITHGTAATTALPNEPQGESLAYTADGASLITVSEIADAPPGSKPTISRYRSALPTITRPGSSRATSSAQPDRPDPAGKRPGTASEGQRPSTATGLSPSGLAWAGAVVLGLLAFGAIRRRRS